MADDVVWKKAPALSNAVLRDALCCALTGRVAAAYLFGSQARGDDDEVRDIDLIVVCATPKPWPERGSDFFDFIDRFGPVDIIVYTPEEWARLERAPTPFLESVRESWQQVV